jgi:hypothetical protein
VRYFFEACFSASEICSVPDGHTNNPHQSLLSSPSAVIVCILCYLSAITTLAATGANFAKRSTLRRKITASLKDAREDFLPKAVRDCAKENQSQKTKPTYRLNENSSKTIILDQNERHFYSPDELSRSISYDFARAIEARRNF